jgi:hypothetical protein
MVGLAWVYGLILRPNLNPTTWSTNDDSVELLSLSREDLEDDAENAVRSGRPF